MFRTKGLLLLPILLATAGCDVPLGTPVGPDPTAGVDLPLLEETIGEESQNPHLGLTAGRLVIVPPPVVDTANDAPDDVDLEELLDGLDGLAPEDEDLIRELIESVTGASNSQGTDDDSLTWGELKQRYAPVF